MFLARPVLSYGNEAWTIRKQQESRLTSGVMKVLRKTAACSLLDYKSNELRNNKRGTYGTTHSRIHTTVQNKTAVACKSNGSLFSANSNVLLRPQRKTVNRNTSTELAGNRNSPIVLWVEKEDGDNESLRTVCTTETRSTHTDEIKRCTYVNTDTIRHGGMDCTTKKIYVRCCALSFTYHNEGRYAASCKALERLYYNPRLRHILVWNQRMAVLWQIFNRSFVDMIVICHTSRMLSWNLSNCVNSNTDTGSRRALAINKCYVIHNFHMQSLRLATFVHYNSRETTVNNGFAGYAGCVRVFGKVETVIPTEA